MIHWLLFIASLLMSPPSFSATSTKWTGAVPEIAKDSSKWAELLAELKSKEMPYGRMAAAARMLVFFPDVPNKETAYRAIIDLVDEGYPHSVQPLFLPGDLHPEGSDYEFINSYNLYKSILNQERGMKRWAEHYFEQIDKENFPKYLLFVALDEYSKGNFKAAEDQLKKILGKVTDGDHRGLIVRVARSLARVYFDQEKYDQSYDIYRNFLLALNPVNPQDFLEASWSLYYLKRYPEAVGMLYNLESRYTVKKFVNLEKYTIRALSYRNLCAIPEAEALIEKFQSDFGPTIEGIKTGETLSKLPQLTSLEVAENRDYTHLTTTLIQMDREKAGIGRISSQLKPLATYLYQSEIQMLLRKYRSMREPALERAAQKLMMMGEHLKFLKFDIQREKFNPDLVFKQSLLNDQPKLLSLDDRYQIHWTQFGDYWRDERLKYRSVLVNRCFE